MRTRRFASVTVAALVALTGAACTASEPAAGGRATASAEASRAYGATLNAAEFAASLDRPGVIVLDVRTPAEYAAGHVAQAKSVPLSRLEQSLPAVVKNKSTPVILVCASGVRSRRAVSIAQKLGYERAVSLAGGLRAWREAGLPVERTAA